MSEGKAVKAGFAVALALCVAGCTASSVNSRGWVRQGPGDVPAEKEEIPKRAAPAPAKTAQSSAPAQPESSPFRAPPAGAAPSPAASVAPAPGAAPAAPSAPGTYTQATRYGDLLFLSGQIAIDPRTNQMVGDKAEDQTRQAMENIRTVLEANRLTMANVVSVTVYLKDMNQFRAMDDVYEGFFRGALPARTVVEVSRLPRGALVEIAVVAGR